MFKLTRVFLLFQLLVLTVNGADHNSVADVKSDVKASKKDFIEDLGTKRGQEIKRHPNDVLLSTVHGADKNSLADVKSDGEALQQNLVEYLGVKRGQKIKRHKNYGKCLHGFNYLPSTGNCYKVVYESLDWYSAVRKCQQLRSGSHLVAITNAEENSDLKTYLATEVSRNLGNTACLPKNFPELGIAYWTSGQQLIKNHCKSPFVWRLSSDKLLAFDFTSWNKGEPNCGNRGEFCVGIEVYNNFVWDDYPCSERFCPLCEYTP